MRLILFDVDSAARRGFEPLCLSRPLWELRCGMGSLAEQILGKVGVSDVACFVPGYMAASYRTKTSWRVNEAAALAGDDLLLVNPQVRASAIAVSPKGPAEVGLAADGSVMYARLGAEDVAKLKFDGIEGLLAAAPKAIPTVRCEWRLWRYTWELMLHNPEQLRADFAARGRGGIEGQVEQPNAIRGNVKDVYIARGVVIHPMVVIDAANGPVYIDEGAEIHPFTRIEGPCYIGRKSILLGAKCREGNSIGPMCRIGGEVEESIIQGYSNKYHDGFLGHAYVGEWVNLGAMTTNSDLKNDYGSVSVVLDGVTPIDTGSTKVGALIGDHTKTSIGTLLNTGACVGAMALILTDGAPLPKYVPSFAWFMDGVVTKGFGKAKLYQTAKTAMGRRKREWTSAEEAMWDAIYEMTAPRRDELVRRGRKYLASK